MTANDSTGDDAIPAAPLAEAEASSLSTRYALYALGIIFLANFLSYLDRQIVSGLEDELTAAFGLGEAAYGALWTAFTVGYMVFAPVIGAMVDRQNRPRLFAVCIFIWSLATMWSGWAGLFQDLAGQLQLYTARFLIGIGEAGCLVIGPTLIADYFSRGVRGRALSIFFLGMPLGGMAGYAVAALATKHLGGWQNAFYFAGLPGIPLAIAVWLLVDPPREGEGPADGHGHGHGKFEGVGPYLELMKNRTLRFIILAQAFAVVILVPLLHFGVKFLQGKFDMTKEQATLRIGVIALVAGVLGNSLSGLIGDRLAGRMRGAYALLAGVAYTVGAPFLILGFATTVEAVMLAALTFGAFCFFLCMPAVNTQIANVVPGHHRARAYALAVFILHLLGDTLAPILFGGASNVLGRETAFIFFSCALFASGVCALLAMRSAQHDEASILSRG